MSLKRQLKVLTVPMFIEMALVMMLGADGQGDGDRKVSSKAWRQVITDNLWIFTT